MRRWRRTRSSLCRARADIRWHIGHILFGGLWAKFGGTFRIDTSALGLTDRSFYKRALHLWSLDNTLTIALDVCHDFMMPIQYLQGPETSNFEIDAESIGQLDWNDGLRQEE